MPYKATIASGKDNVIIAGRGPYTAGDVVMLTDEEMAALKSPAALFAAIFTGAPTALNTATTSPYS